MTAFSPSHSTEASCVYPTGIKRERERESGGRVVIMHRNADAADVQPEQASTFPCHG